MRTNFEEAGNLEPLHAFAGGQFADLVNDVGGLPTLDQVLDVARRKSGNYTVSVCTQRAA